MSEARQKVSNTRDNRASCKRHNPSMTRVTKQEFLSRLHCLLNYHQACGIVHYPDRLKLPSAQELLGDVLVAEAAAVHKAHHTGSEEAAPEPGSGVEGGTEPIVQLHAEIARCQNCSLHRDRQVSTAGKGGSGDTPVKLMIVGDWLTTSVTSLPQQGVMFGEEQDAMLNRMMTAIELEPEAVYVTNVIKCSIDEVCQPTAEHIACCSSYLQMQIDLLQPSIICSMGIIASRLLTKQAKPLSQQRGTFYSHKTRAGYQLPVIPTYHPTYLLKNPEMKQATWADLQLIKRELAEK